MKRKNLAGRVFGNLTVLHQARRKNSPRALWLCRCVCGAEVTARSDNLLEGRKKSCGLDHKFRKHPAKYKKDCTEYGIYNNMIQRCTNPNSNSWRYYGARGIFVCDRWQESFDNFLDDMGRRPSAAYSIDRINNDGDYEPSNCRWATIEQQSQNRRGTIKALFQGNMVSVFGFAEAHGLNYGTVRRRLEIGWSLEKILGLAKDGQIPCPQQRSRSRLYAKTP